MDRDQEEFRNLGFVGIYRVSFKTIFRWRRIFTQITLALILPFCILSLAQSKVFELFFGKNLTNGDLGAYTYDEGAGELAVGSKYGLISIWVVFVILVLFLSLLATAAVVYTIACIYALTEVTFRKVMSVALRVWKRLLCTFFWSFAVYVPFILISVVLLVIWVYFIRTTPVGIAYIVIWIFFFFMAYLYITIICQLSYVVSVLEDDYGWKAIMKSKALIKGKMGAAVGCYLVFLVCLAGVQLVFDLFVSISSLGIGLRIPIGLGSLVLVVLLYLLLLVYQTVIYFVCKSYHHESIDRPSLTHQLEGYSKIKDVELDRVNNV